MGFRIEHRYSEIMKKPRFYVYQTGWFWRDFLGAADTRNDAEKIIKDRVGVEEYHIDYDKYGNVDN